MVLQQRTPVIHLGASGRDDAAIPTVGMTMIRRQQRKDAQCRLLRAVRRVIIGLLVIVVVCTLAFGALVRHGGNHVAQVLGHPVLMVLSGSMTPTFRTGDLIVDLHVTAEKPMRRGQIITFEEPGSGGQLLITHRIYRVVRTRSIPGDALGIGYVTKGDANSGPDPWVVTPAEVMGLYETHIPLAGYAMRVVETRWAFIVALLIAAVWVFGGTFRRHWHAAGLGPLADKGTRLGAVGADDKRIVNVPAVVTNGQEGTAPME